jgi:RHS repeat-associated protein
MVIHPNAEATLVRDAASRILTFNRGGDVAQYSYDLMDQLTNVAHSSGSPETYQYNPMGVRLSSHSLPGSATVGAANRLLTAADLAFRYDPEGNLIQRENTNSGELMRFSYDHRNQMVLATLHSNPAAPPTLTVAFEYDYEGRMMSRSVDGKKTWIVYDRDMPFAEFEDGSNAVSAAFCYSPDRPDDFHATWRSGIGQRWFLKDHLGTVQGATDPDGRLVYWADYDAFGQLRSSPPPDMDPVRFAGRIWNEALGLYELRARFYDPGLGRFIQEDPAGFRGGDLDLYAYAGNNPMIWKDPYGRTALTEYVEIMLNTAKPEVYCKFGACVANLWGSMVRSVLTLQAAKPSGENCGLILLELPEPPPSSFSEFQDKVQNDLLKKAFGPYKDLYDAVKACQDYGAAVSGIN